MKAHIKKIIGSSAVYGLGSVSNQILAFLLVPVYCHILPVAEYGKLTYYNLLGSIFTMIIVLGMISSLYRYYHQAEKDQRELQLTSTVFWFIFTLGCVVSVILLLLAPLISHLVFHDSLKPAHIRLVVVYTYISSLNGIYYGIIRYKNRAVEYISVTVTKTLASLSLNVFFIAVIHYGIVGILITNAIVEASVFLFMVLNKKGFVALTFDLSLMRRMLRFGAPGIVANIGSYMLSYTGIYYLRGQESLDVVGQYGFALKFSTLISIFVIDPFDQAWTPIKFKMLDSPNHMELFARLLDYIVFIAGWLGLAVSLLVPDVIGILSSAGYHAAARLVPFLCLSVIFFGAYRISTMGSEVAEKTHWRALIVLIAGLVNLGLNALLTPHYGIVGVLTSLNLSYFFLFAASMVYSQHSFHIPYRFIRMAKSLAVMALLYVVVVPLRLPIYLNIPVKILVLLATPALLFLIRYFYQDERSFLLRTLGELRHGRLPRFSLRDI